MSINKIKVLVVMHGAGTGGVEKSLGILCKYLDKEGNLMQAHKRDPKPKARRMKTEDRRILEKVILPHFSQEESCQRILFVGCASYTMWYDEFFEKKEYWTLEPQKENRCYGAKRHIIDNVPYVVSLS